MAPIDPDTGEVQGVPPHAVHVDVDPHAQGIGGTPAPDPFAAPATDDLQPLNMAAMTGDVAGKGRKIKLKADPKPGGARLSKNAKTMAVFFGAVVFGGIMVGVLTAGRHPSAAKKEAGQVGSDAPGEVQADVTQMQRAADHLYAPKPTAQASAPLGTPAHSLAAATPLPALPATPPALTPAQKYAQWQEQQHYKQLEGQDLAADSALTATPALQVPRAPSAVALAGAAAPGNAADTAALLRAALDSAKHIPVPPASDAGGAGLGGLLSVLHAQTQALGGGTDGGQAANSAFVHSQSQDAADGYLHHSAHQARSPNEVFAGSVIPAALETGINSDLPGDVTALVVEPVYDSINGTTVLIPQGTKALGRYSSAVVYGQQRVLVVWNRLLFPNGATVNLAGMEGTDQQGESGFYDQVDNHYGRVFGSAILMSLLGVGAQLSQPQNSGALNSPSISAQAAGALGMQLNNTGTALLQKNLNIQPTLTTRPGYRFNILVNRTMILPPYRGQ